jgi:DNA-binding transcriptional ArsR family regulator
MSEVNSERCKEVAAILKNLAHKERLMILCFLSEKSRNVNELAEFTGCSQSSVSQFVNKMRLQGILDSTREGRFVNYFIADKKIKQLIQALHEIYG